MEDEYISHGNFFSLLSKIDYIFNDKSKLTIVREHNNSSCIYEVNNQNKKEINLDVWFKCPKADWPGYAELHQLVFIDTDKLIDTYYVQGIPNRVEGEFYKIHIR